jgi:hypothetical protein
MSLKYYKFGSEQKSLDKMDILLAESVSPMVMPPESGHYSRRKKLSMSPQGKQKTFKVQ